MNRIVRAKRSGWTLRIALLGALLVAVVIAPVHMARGVPRPRMVTLPAGVEHTAGYRAAFVGPNVPPPPGKVIDMPFPLSHLAARWFGNEEAVVEVRTSSVDGEGASFGPWQALMADHDLEDSESGRTFSQLVRVDGARRVQVRAAGGATGVEIVGIDTVYGPRPWVMALGRPAAAAEQGEDPEAAATTTTSTTAPAPRDANAVAPSTTTSSSTTTTRPGSTSTTSTTGPGGTTAKEYPQPSITTRAEWGADESKRKPNPPKYAPVTKLFVHHTVTSPGATDPDPASTVRAIYQFHTQSRGWDDIGYNFLVDHTGKIYEGRWAQNYEPGEVPTGENDARYGVAGAHAEQYNFGTASISVIGDFTDVEPTSAAMKSVEKFLAWKADRHDIDVTESDPFVNSAGVRTIFPNLAGHRDVGQTACPGNRLYALLPGVRSRVADLISLGSSSTAGYWTATADGRVIPFGDAEVPGTMAGTRLNAPIVGMERTISGNGYWLLGGDGGIFTFGDAKFYGSTGGMRLSRPVVRMAATPTGNGYWLVASDGGVFTFGDAKFHGSTGAMVLNQPVVGMAPTKTGEGYWLVASDGGIFSFGDARFHGSTGDLQLASPVASMATAPDATGYWLVAKDGGVFAFNVPFLGSVPGLGTALYAGAVQLRSTSTGKGYYVADAGGGVSTFGDARYYGSDMSNKESEKPTLKDPAKAAVDIVVIPSSSSSSRTASGRGSSGDGSSGDDSSTTTTTEPSSTTTSSTTMTTTGVGPVSESPEEGQ